MSLQPNTRNVFFDQKSPITSGRRCFELSRTNTQRVRHTYGYWYFMTELAQWALGPIIEKAAICFEKSFIYKLFFFFGIDGNENSHISTFIKSWQKLIKTAVTYSRKGIVCWIISVSTWQKRCLISPKYKALSGWVSGKVFLDIIFKL